MRGHNYRFFVEKRAEDHADTGRIVRRECVVSLLYFISCRHLDELSQNIPQTNASLSVHRRAFGLGRKLLQQSASYRSMLSRPQDVVLSLTSLFRKFGDLAY